MTILEQISHETMEQLEEIKKLILIKKKPNRKPFPKDHAIYAKMRPAV